METSKIYKIYKKIEQPFLDSGKKRWTMMGITVVLLLISMLAFATKWVAVKMLPFDNKNEIQVVIDMPEGTTLERTASVSQEIAQYLKTVPEVVNYQSYVGSSAPITFNGLVRHYDMRGQSNTADIQVNLLHKEDRDNNCTFFMKVQDEKSAEYAGGVFLFRLADELVIYLLPISYKSGKNITGKIQFGQWTLRESKTFRNNICRLVYRFKE
jgi:multidrug efflux pump subunit AcrB